MVDSAAGGAGAGAGADAAAIATTATSAGAATAGAGAAEVGMEQIVELFQNQRQRKFKVGNKEAQQRKTSFFVRVL